MKIFNFFNTLIILTFSLDISAQTPMQQLDPSFLESLDPDIKASLESTNNEEESELEALFRSSTSAQNNREILENLKNQINALEESMASKNDFLNNLSPSKDLERFGENFFRSLQSTFMPINMPNLDSRYIVDVGDAFKLSLIGETGTEHELEIIRSGSLVIPEYGSVQLAGLSLSQANDAVRNFMRNADPGLDVIFHLKEIRDMQIVVLGFVEAPGVYTVSGGSNILGVLNAAGGITENGSYRRIKILRNGSVIDTVDLYQTFVYGRNSFMTPIRSGDIIFVEASGFNIPVSGGVNNNAIFEMLEGESIGDAINFASGFSTDFFGFDSLKVFRQYITSSNYLTVKKDQVSNFKLQPRDAILVPSFKNEIQKSKIVHINGRVKNPGTYYMNDGDTLSALIKRAGGYEDDAYIFGAALFREEALNKEKSFAQLNYSDTVNFVIGKVGNPDTAIDSSVLGLLREEVNSYAYTGRIVTEFDIDAITQDPSLDTVLQSNDRITIPPIQKVVYLFGDFRNPSNIAYSPELGLRDYIKLVGGKKESAFEEIIIINPDGKTSIHDSSFFNLNTIDVYPGTIVYAPRNIGKLSGIRYASTVAPILSSLAISLASLNSIND